MYKILLVEDATVAQHMAYTILNDMGYEVHLAGSGGMAISKVDQMQFDIIFMDLGLPDIDGFSTTEAIRKIELKQRRAKKSLIVALTSHEGEHVRITCMDNQMDDFLIKPLSEEKIAEVLKRHSAVLES